MGDATWKPSPTAAGPAGLGLRRLAGDTGVYALATAAGPLAALVAVPVLTRELGPVGFGTIDLLLSLTTLAGVIAVMGMDTAAARSWFDEDTPGARRPAVVGTAVRAVALASCLLAALLALAVLVLGVANTGLGTATALAAFLTFPIISIQAMLREIFRLEGRRRWYVAVAACSAILGSGSAVVLVLAAGMGPAGYFVGLGAGALAALALAAAGSRNALFAPLDRAELRIMLRFGLPLVPASVAMWTLLLADRAVVGAFRGLEEVGLYGLGNRVAAPLFLAVQAFQVAWIPFALRVHRDARGQEPFVRGRAATLVLAVTTSGAVALVAFASPLVGILGGSGFDRAVAAVLPLTVAWVAYAGSVVGFLPFSIARRSAGVAKVTAACAAVGLVLALVLVPAFGFAGAAWATAVAYLLLGGLALRLGQRISPAVFDRRRLAGVGAVGAAALPAAALVDAAGGTFLARGAVWAAATTALAGLVLTAARGRGTV